MDKKDIKDKSTKQRDPEREVRFCLNCNDMDDLATSEEAKDLDQLHERFRNCNETGRFDGDICARIFVAEDGIDDADLFADDDEDE
ncbi:MAG: hypothetical protein RRA94_16305 [Bacteroidota bacterium]|nr:hypothetical protein [Bacteroidota bacterium]